MAVFSCCDTKGHFLSSLSHANVLYGDCFFFVEYCRRFDRTFNSVLLCEDVCERESCLTTVHDPTQNGLRIASSFEMCQSQWTRYMKTRAFLRAVAQPSSHVKNKTTSAPPPLACRLYFKKNVLSIPMRRSDQLRLFDTFLSADVAASLDHPCTTFREVAVAKRRASFTPWRLATSHKSGDTDRTAVAALKVCSLPLVHRLQVLCLAATSIHRYSIDGRLLRCGDDIPFVT